MSKGWWNLPKYQRDRCGRNRMVVGFTTTCAVRACHQWSCKFESCSCQGVLDTTLCDKVVSDLGHSYIEALWRLHVHPHPFHTQKKNNKQTKIN